MDTTYLSEIKQKLRGYLDEYNDRIINTILKDITIDGKMIRSSFIYAIAASFNKVKIEDIYTDLINTSCIIELLHLATIVHDDVLDESSTRRGQNTVNKLHGNRIAILGGDLLFSKSFSLMSKNISLQNINIISDACINLVCGEINQESMINNYIISMDEYLSIIQDKTARLFQAGSMIVGNIIDIKSEKFSTTGLNIGIAFQLFDDFIDYFGDEAKMKKPKYQDFLSGKVTIPLIFLRESISMQDVQYLVSSQNIPQLTNLMKDNDIAKKVLSLIHFYIDKALQEAKSIPDINHNFDKFIDKFRSFLNE